MTNLSIDKSSGIYRNLSEKEIDVLESQGCKAKDWKDVVVKSPETIKDIHDVYFSGPVELGDGVSLRNIKGGIGNCRVEDGAIIENVTRIDFEPGALMGVGVQVNVLDETGSRPVRIYPGLSSQIAVLMARDPKWVETRLGISYNDFLDSKELPPVIGENAVIRDSGRLTNVHVGAGVVIEGAFSLKNGAIINNAVSGKNLAYIGYGVIAENFIAEDAKIDNSCIIHNCYVGQGAELANGFTAHDSLFFANSSFENGEACALLAGPYTVSMHKGTLLIGCQTSFMNAGSSTNESNHMYKLGPVHWGLLERGVKTSSGAYIMFGAKIGAFSMVMGAHKTHPDSSHFPFSYLFGDEKGATIIVPGAMLRSCGLMRDEQKWPTRDRRKKRRMNLNDRVTFNVLNPYTVDSMLTAIDTVTELLSHPADDDLYVRHKGMKATRAALERAKQLYTTAIYKYLYLKLGDSGFPENDGKEVETWVDIGGQILPRPYLEKSLEAESIEEVERLFDEAHENYENLETRWIGRRFGDHWRENVSQIAVGAKQFDEMVEADRDEYLTNLSRESKMLSL